MLQLYIDGEIVNLSKDLQTDYYVKSPFFTNEGDFTLDIDINLRDPQNAKVYRLINRLDRVKRASRREAVLQDEHGVLLRGREVILETHDGYAKIQIVGGTSELNYIMSDTYLQDLDLWMSFERNEVEYAPVCAYNQAPHAKYGMMDSEQYKTEGGKRVLVWTMVNKPTWAADGTLNMSHDTPLPYFWAIINRVITALGFKVGDNVIQTDSRYSQMVMVHAYKTPYIADMLPRWTVTQLFDEYQKFFNVIFDVDKKTRTVNIYHAHSYFNTNGMEEIPYSDIIDEVEKKFDVDNDMTMVNYARAHYAFTDKLQNKYSALSPELVRICTKEDAQIVSGADEFDKNYYVGVWKAKTGGESFLSSTSAIAGTDERKLYRQVINGEDRFFVQWASENDYNGLVMVNAFAPKTSTNDNDTDVEMKIVPVRMASSPKVGSSPWWTHPLPAVDGEASSWGGHEAGGEALQPEVPADDIVDDIENGYDPKKKAERADVMFAGFYLGEVAIQTWEDLRDNNVPAAAKVPIVAPENIMQIHRPRTYGDGKSWKCSLNVLVGTSHLTMAIVGDYGMYANNYSLNPHVDTATEYTIRFRGRANLDVRKVWLIGNRKFYCKELKCQLNAGYRSEIIEGTFFPLLMAGASEGGETIFYVTYNLSRVIIENRIPQVLANEPLHLDLSIAQGFPVSANTVINALVTMGGVDITSSAFTRDGRRATIDIADVTGDVYIQSWVGQAQVLPYDAEVEWLQSDGSGGRAYIDTGIQAANTVTFDINLNIGNNVNSQVFGARNGYNNKQMNVYFDFTNNKTYWGYGSNMYYIANPSAGTYSIKNTSNSRIVNINGTSITAGASTFTSNYNIYLFALNNAGSAAQPGSNSQIKIYSAKFYSSGTLVRDYIPVRKNGVGYLYDKVSNTLFGNANSTGSFTYGSDKTT